jgi:hypothetical protein
MLRVETRAPLRWSGGDAELNPKEDLWDEIREKILKNYALKSIDAVRRKLEQAIPGPCPRTAGP